MSCRGRSWRSSGPWASSPSASGCCSVGARWSPVDAFGDDLVDTTVAVLRAQDRQHLAGLPGRQRHGGVRRDRARPHRRPAGRQADLEAVAVFGGVELTVPPGWRVQLDGPAIFGGHENNVPAPVDAGRTDAAGAGDCHLRRDRGRCRRSLAGARGGVTRAAPGSAAAAVVLPAAVRAQPPACGAVERLAAVLAHRRHVQHPGLLVAHAGHGQEAGRAWRWRRLVRSSEEVADQQQQHVDPHGRGHTDQHRPEPGQLTANRVDDAPMAPSASSHCARTVACSTSTTPRCGC